MDVNIEEVQTTVRAVDSQQLLAPEVMARIVAMVLAELERARALEAQRASDRAASARAGRRR